MVRTPAWLVTRTASCSAEGRTEGFGVAGVKTVPIVTAVVNPGMVVGAAEVSTRDVRVVRAERVDAEVATTLGTAVAAADAEARTVTRSERNVVEGGTVSVMEAVDKTAVDSWIVAVAVRVAARLVN